MKKFNFLIIGLVLLSFLTGCGGQGKTEKLPEEEVSKYLEMSKSTIEEFSENGFKNLEENMDDQIKEAITEDSEKQILEIIQKKGAFVEYKDGDAVRYIDEKTDNSFIVTQQKVEYEKGELIYTVNLNDQEKIIGFFVK